MPVSLLTLRDLTADCFPWAAWERLIGRRGVEIDRPARTTHPDFPEVIYPLDYGFIPETRATDGEPVDCFRGSAERLGLVGLLLTADHRQSKREVKLLYNTAPPEVYCAHGFINFDPRLLEGILVMRRPMRRLWELENVGS